MFLDLVPEILDFHWWSVFGRSFTSAVGLSDLDSCWTHWNFHLRIDLGGLFLR